MDQRSLPTAQPGMTRAMPTRRAVIMALGVTSLGDLGSKIAVLITTLAAANLVDPDRFAGYVGLMAISLIAGALWDAGISTVVSVEGARDAPFDRLVRRVVRARSLTLPIALAALAIGFLVFGQITPLE